jgi:hypothetical protein
MRITCSAPEALIPQANQLAMCLGQSEADGETYRGLNWTDGTNLYAAASFEASEEWITFAQAPLTRPAWDTEEVIDMDAAAAAQATMVFWQATEEAPTPPAALPGQLTAIGGMDGVEALAAMGLTAVEGE